MLFSSHPCPWALLKSMNSHFKNHGLEGGAICLDALICFHLQSFDHQCLMRKPTSFQLNVSPKYPSISIGSSMGGHVSTHSECYARVFFLDLTFSCLVFHFNLSFHCAPLTTIIQDQILCFRGLHKKIYTPFTQTSSAYPYCTWDSIEIFFTPLWLRIPEGTPTFQRNAPIMCNYI